MAGTDVFFGSSDTSLHGDQAEGVVQITLDYCSVSLTQQFPDGLPVRLARVLGREVGRGDNDVSFQSSLSCLVQLLLQELCFGLHCLLRSLLSCHHICKLSIQVLSFHPNLSDLVGKLVKKTKDLLQEPPALLGPQSQLLDHVPQPVDGDLHVGVVGVVLAVHVELVDADVDLCVL